jgi:hypothetical protein
VFAFVEITETLSPHHVVDSEEAVVMAQWLEMITLKVASENPANTHAQLLGSTPCLFR